MRDVKMFRMATSAALAFLVGACGAEWSKPNATAGAAYWSSSMPTSAAANAGGSTPTTNRVVWLPKLTLMPVSPGAEKKDGTVSGACQVSLAAEFGLNGETLRSVVLRDVDGNCGGSAPANRRFYQLNPVFSAGREDACGSKIYVGALEARPEADASGRPIPRSLIRVVDHGSRHCDDRPGGTIELTEINGAEGPEKARSFVGSW